MLHSACGVPKGLLAGALTRLETQIHKCEALVDAHVEVYCSSELLTNQVAECKGANELHAPLGEDFCAVLPTHLTVPICTPLLARVFYNL